MVSLEACGDVFSFYIPSGGTDAVCFRISRWPRLSEGCEVCNDKSFVSRGMDDHKYISLVMGLDNETKFLTASPETENSLLMFVEACGSWL